MSAICKICGKEFKNTQGLRGHNTFVHKMVKTSDNQSIQPPTENRFSDTERPPDLRDNPLTEQVNELNQQVNKLTEQLNELAVQVGLTRDTQTILDANGKAQNKQFEQLRSEWIDAHDKLLSLINRNSDSVNGNLSVAEERIEVTNTLVEVTNTLVNELRSIVGQLEERVKSKVVSENQLRANLNIVEQKLAHFDSEVDKVRNLAIRQPTGKVVSHPEYEASSQEYKEYKSPEGLAQPCRVSRDLFFGDRWIDLAEPEK